MVPKQWLRLRQLVESLSPQEKHFFRRVLDASNIHMKESKLVKLLESVEKGFEEADVDALARNRKLLELFEDRILDSLTMDVSLVRKGGESGPLLHLRVQKKFLKCQVLEQRAVMSRAYVLAGTCAGNAAKLEDYDLALQCLRLQISMVTLHKCEEDFHKLLQQIDHYDYRNQLKNQAIRLYRELKLKKYLGIGENIDLFVENSMRKLEGFLKKVNLGTVEIIYLFFKKELHELREDLHEALEVVQELHEACQRLDGRQTILTQYELTAEQGRLSFLLGKTKAARFFLMQSVQSLPVESDCHQASRELIFLMEYSAGNTEVCRKHLSEFTTHSYFKNNLADSIKARWLYYHSCLLLRTQEPTKCLRKIDEMFRTGKPPMDLNLHLRFMRLMCFIDLEKMDLADKEVDALRKYIGRNELQSLMSEMGLEDIFDMFWQLRYCGYLFCELHKRNVDVGKIMECRATYLRKQGLKHHLVPYSAWLERKRSADPIRGNSPYGNVAS